MDILVALVLVALFYNTEPVFMLLFCFLTLLEDIKETLNWSQVIKW